MSDSPSPPLSTGLDPRLASLGPGEAIADLVAEGADLQERDLRGVRLPRARLRGAHLERANLTGAHLEGADLREAFLSEANLTGAHLEGADLSQAVLERATLVGTDLSAARLEGATAHLSSWKGGVAVGMRGSGMILDGADLEEVDFTAADLTGAQMVKTQVTRCQWEDARLDNGLAHLSSWTDCTVTGMRAPRIDWSGTFLAGLIGTGVDLRGANLRGARFKGGALASCRMEEADFRGAEIEGTDLSRSTAHGGWGLEGELGNRLRDAGARVRRPGEVPWLTATETFTIALSWASSLALVTALLGGPGVPDDRRQGDHRDVSSRQGPPNLAPTAEEEIARSPSQGAQSSSISQGTSSASSDGSPEDGPDVKDPGGDALEGAGYDLTGVRARRDGDHLHMRFWLLQEMPLNEPRNITFHIDDGGKGVDVSVLTPKGEGEVEIRASGSPPVTLMDGWERLGDGFGVDLNLASLGALLNQGSPLVLSRIQVCCRSGPQKRPLDEVSGTLRVKAAVGSSLAPKQK